MVTLNHLMEFKNLKVGFGGCQILSQLNGCINQGELIALMGINGVGKSCLLKTLSGLHPSMSGEIYFQDKKLSDLGPRERSLSLSVVLTEKPAVDYLRVFELIALGRSPHTNFWGELNKLDEEIIFKVLELLDIVELKNRFFDGLSDGQKQKVLLARALAQEPSLLILDEPTTYLDIPSKVELMNLLLKISREKNMAVLFSTHDLNLIEDIVDQVWLIEKEGNLIQKSPKDMKSSGLYLKNFNI